MNSIAKYFLIGCVCFSCIGLLPVTGNFILHGKKSQPNVLVISKDEVNRNSCFYRDASIRSGIISIAPELAKNSSRIDPGAITIAGNNPFLIYDSMFNTQDIIVQGKVIALDPLGISDSSSYRFVPRFYVESWATNNYYPRFRIYPNSLRNIFFISGIFAFLTILFFMLFFLQKISRV